MNIRDIITLIEEHSSIIKLYHITDKARFNLDPDYEPIDNSISIEDRSGRKGIYLTQDVEKWVNGHGYLRPFVAEIYADPSILEMKGRWAGEIFVPKEHFEKLKVNRVVPLDVIARETYGAHGWIESSNGYEFDTGNQIDYKKVYPYNDYKYSGDTRKMSSDEIKKLKKHFSTGYKNRLKYR